MSERALILSADTWEMPDERTGEIRKGVSVWYINQYRENEPGKIGFKPTKISATPEMFQTLSALPLPGLFEMGFGSRPGKDGKATLTLVGVKALGEVDVFSASKTPKAGV